MGFLDSHRKDLEAQNSQARRQQDAIQAWKEDNFALLDRLTKLCEKYNVEFGEKPGGRKIDINEAKTREHFNRRFYRFNLSEEDYVYHFKAASDPKVTYNEHFLVFRFESRPHEDPKDRVFGPGVYYDFTKNIVGRDRFIEAELGPEENKFLKIKRINRWELDDISDEDFENVFLKYLVTGQFGSNESGAYVDNIKRVLTTDEERENIKRWALQRKEYEEEQLNKQIKIHTKKRRKEVLGRGLIGGLLVGGIGVYFVLNIISWFSHINDSTIGNFTILIALILGFLAAEIGHLNYPYENGVPFEVSDWMKTKDKEHKLFFWRKWFS